MPTKPEINDLRLKFDKLLNSLGRGPVANFTTVVETAFEAVICVKTMNEYVKIYGKPLGIYGPVVALGGAPGKFRKDKAYKIKFKTEVFYFATDVECFGLSAYHQGKPVGDFFEADVVVINEEFIHEIEMDFGGRPAPQHLDAAYECKFGAFHKHHLRELLGLRRHLSFLNQVPTKSLKSPFDLDVKNSDPAVQIIMFRPFRMTFLDAETQNLYDLNQIIYC